MTADGKYSLLSINNLEEPIQMQLSQEQKFFSEFFSQRLKYSFNFEDFQKKLTLIRDVFPKLGTPKNVLRSMSEKSYFRWSFEKQDSKPVQTLLNSKREHLYQIYWSLSRQLTYKMSLLVTGKILKLFVNTLAANEKYSLLNRGS